MSDIISQSRTRWYIDTYNGSTWTLQADYVYAPNANFSIGYTATQAKVNLADGGLGYINPEVEYQREDLTFQWLEIPLADGMQTRVENHVKAQTILRITDSLGTQYTGTFVRVNRVWLSGTDNTYDVEAVFSRSLG